MLKLFLQKWSFVQRMQWPTHGSPSSIVSLPVKQILLISSITLLSWLDMAWSNCLAHKRLCDCLQVYAWGWGRYGNLGDGERSDRQGHTAVCCMSKCASAVPVHAQACCSWPGHGHRQQCAFLPSDSSTQLSEGVAPSMTAPAPPERNLCLGPCLTCSLSALSAGS